MEFTDRIKNELAMKFYAESRNYEYYKNKYESAIIVLKSIKPHINLEELTKLYLGFKIFSEWVESICEEQKKEKIISNPEVTDIDADFEETSDEISAIDKELLTVEFIRKIVLGKFQ